MRPVLLLLCMLLSSQAISASVWHLDNAASTLNFFSSKTPQQSAPIVEENKFKQLTGTIDNRGKAVLVVDLHSVDTRVPLRDARLQEQVFEVKKYPTATFTTQLDHQKLAQYADKGIHTIPLRGILYLHGVQHNIDTEVTLQWLDEKHVQVQSTTPIMIDAAAFDLQSGVLALQKLMSLDNISLAVPVRFTLIFVSVGA